MKNIISEINNLIKESQSVSLVVDEICQNLMEKIDKVCGNVLIVDSYGKYGINTYRTGFSETILENTVFVDCVIVQGKNIECLKHYLTIEKMPENCFFIDKKTKQESLRFIVYYIGEDMWYNNMDAIYHEVEHLYQHLLRKKKDKSYDFLKQEEDYNNGIKLMNSTSFFEQKIGILLYMSDLKEQDAFVQGLCGELKGFYGSGNFIEYEKTTVRRVLYNYETSLKILKKEYLKNKEEIDKILEKHNINYKKLIKNSELGIKRFRSKIGRVLSYFTFNPKDVLTKSLFKEIVEEISKDKDIKK